MVKGSHKPDNFQHMDVYIFVEPVWSLAQLFLEFGSSCCAMAHRTSVRLRKMHRKKSRQALRAFTNSPNPPRMRPKTASHRILPPTLTHLDLLWRPQILQVTGKRPALHLNRPGRVEPEEPFLNPEKSETSNVLQFHWKNQSTGSSPFPIWLVVSVSTPLKNDGLRQLGWWHSQYLMENNPAMFGTTNQQLIIAITLGSSPIPGHLRRTCSKRLMRDWRSPAGIRGSVLVSRLNHCWKIPRGRAAWLGPSEGDGKTYGKNAGIRGNYFFY